MNKKIRIGCYGIILAVFGIFFLLVVFNNIRRQPTQITEDIFTKLHLQECSISDKRPAIFFLETTCSSCYHKRFLLTTRQACAVESAAKMNPNSNVYVLFTALVTFDNSPMFILKDNLVTLLTYNNTYLCYSNVYDYTRNTPIEKWYDTEAIKKSHYETVHTSDVLRLLTLWKYGGTYLDLDFVVMETLEDLELDFIVEETKYNLGNSVLRFKKTGPGHEAVEQALEMIVNDFKGQSWGYNGPVVVTEVMKKLCGTDIVENMVDTNCTGIKVYPYYMFYPISWNKWQLLFDENQTDSVIETLYPSKALHVWNKMSSGKKVIVNSRQTYNIVARNFCPRIYSEVDDYF